MADGKSDLVPKPSGAGHRRLAPVEPAALKAFAHPLRMAMYTELQRLGSATASQLARSLGESSGQTSYHLRQLERHGFVEDDPLHKGGRDRWWRPVGFDLTEPSLMRDPATAGPVRAIVQQVIAERAAALSAWFSSLDPTDDDGPGLLSSSTLALTREEAEELTGELNGLLTRIADEIRDRTPPDGAQRFRIHVDVFPLDGAGKP
ncbi:MAG TPA: helix-turn-helix domain-containing protein [Propionicimonas sp.]|uniref:helix-turn-helix domain-containing protein n=1 Tax=Propionicimonas sp. TaxID=1955623 RepID=UPI002F40AF9A